MARKTTPAGQNEEPTGPTPEEVKAADDAWLDAVGAAATKAMAAVTPHPYPSATVLDQTRRVIEHAVVQAVKF